MGAKKMIQQSGELAQGQVWFVQDQNQVRIGLTGLGLDAVGEVIRVELPNEGDELEADELLLSVDGSVGRLDIGVPATGYVVRINETLLSEPEALAEDPWDEGWLVQIEIEEPEDLV